MTTLNSICDVIGRNFPNQLAEDWDNVGLLVGDPAAPIRSVMTCLTISPEVVREGIREGADLIVVHHPLPFRPVKRLTTESYVGGMLWQLAKAGIAVYSAHTAYDSAALGINRQWADLLSLKEIRPIVPYAADSEVGVGRTGKLPNVSTLKNLALDIKSRMGLSWIQMIGAADRQVQSVGIACGAGADFYAAAKAVGCDVLLTGEARFHTCLEAKGEDLALILVGHYASERPAMEHLANWLKQQLPDLHVWASKDEEDPVVGL